jgi:hypothetical protein
MINKYTECYLGECFDSMLIEKLVKVILDNGYKGISLSPSIIDIVGEYTNYPNLYLNLDHPFSFHTSDIRLLVLKEYIKKYSELIKGINLSPVYSFLNNWSIEKIREDFDIIAKICNKSKIETRMFLDISYYSNDVIYRISDLANQSGINRVVLGCFNKKYFNLQDTLIHIDKIKKFSNIKTGIFGAFDLDETNDYKYFSESNLKTGNDIIFLKPKKILSNFNDSV